MAKIKTSFSFEERIAGQAASETDPSCVQDCDFNSIIFCEESS